MLENLKNNEGLTLKNFKPVTYKTGYQVATEGYETGSLGKAEELVKSFNGTCGVWYADGIYYIDKSHRENTKTKALEIGRACKQISILKWSNMSLIYC